MCASRGCSSRLAHIAKSAMYAPPQTGRRCSVSAGSRERSRNVPWNQWLHKVRTYRGLCGRTRGGALHVCIQGLLITSRTHRKKRDVCATPDWEEVFRLCRLSGTKPECALESMASQSAHLSRIVWAHSWRCSPCVHPGAAHHVSHTSQKARSMRYPRLGGGVPSLPTLGNEAGMCPGINGFTKCAPIADCVGALVAVLAMCASRGCSSRLAHIAK